MRGEGVSVRGEGVRGCEMEGVRGCGCVRV